MTGRSRYKVLIVGCGNIAGGFDALRPAGAAPLTHAGAFTAHGGFDIAACVDPDERKRSAFAGRWSVKAQAASMAEFGDAPGEFHVVSICSPTEQHHENLRDALHLRPRAIFCEKPLATREEDAANWINVCRAEGVSLIINYTRRWDPAVADVLKDLHSGKWGVVRSIVGHYNKGILNNGGHMIDLLLRIVGPMDVVSAACGRADFRESDPTLAVLLTSQVGRVPVYLNPSDAGDFAYFELEIVCSLGVVRMRSGGMSWEFRETVSSPDFVGYRSLGAPAIVEGRYPEAMSFAVRNIHDYLEGGPDPGDFNHEVLELHRLCNRIQKTALAAESSVRFQR